MQRDLGHGAKPYTTDIADSPYKAYLGEIRMIAGMTAPKGWVVCEGQLLPIAKNPDLFDMLGTTYGGDGKETFALPDLRGRVPVCAGQGNGLGNISAGQQIGAESVSLNASHCPTHTHTVFSAKENSAPGPVPDGALFGMQAKLTGQVYGEAGKLVAMDADAVTTSGDGEPHNNMQPFLAVNFIISLNGIRPK